MKLLTICPSRIRPDRVMDMIASWDKTRSDFNHLVIYVADDDPKLEQYRENLKERNLIVGKRLPKVGVDNYVACDLFPDCQYYAEINDDHIYHTKEWDKILIDEIEFHGGWGQACSNMSGLPSGSITSGNVIRALGYWFYPELEQAYGDNFHQELFEALGMFYRVPNVDIEHRHWIYGKAENDDNYRMVTSQEHMKHGLEMLNEWRNLFKEKDIEKIRNASRGVNP